MLISHKYKFIFIHVYKVAGTSIKSSLSKYAEVNLNQISKLTKIKYLNNIPLSGNFEPHISAYDLSQKIPKRMFNSYFKFAFVRNPYDWQISLYEYMKQQPTHFQHNLVKKMAFNEYCNWRIKADFHLQQEMICDSKGNLLVDFIGKIENINKDLKTIEQKLKLPNLELEHLNKSIRSNINNYYEINTKKLIAVNFKADFDLFNYDY